MKNTMTGKTRGLAVQGMLYNAKIWLRGPRTALFVVPALFLTACAADQIVATNTKSSVFDKPDWAVSSWDLAGSQKKTAREVKPEELVGADGLCASLAPAQPPEPAPPLPSDVAPTPPPVISMSNSFTSEGRSPVAAAPAPAPGPQSGGAPSLTGGIALDMTECQVVQRAGIIADRVEIGANERNERAVTLTFMRGERPGIYRFVAGRLVSIERGPTPPPEPKPVKQAKPAKKIAKPAAPKPADNWPSDPKPSNAVQSAPLREPTKITVGR